MGSCEVCGASDEFLFRCQHCAEPHCEEHHPVDAHHCEAVPTETSAIDWGPPPEDLEGSTHMEPAQHPRDPTSSEPAVRRTLVDVLPPSQALGALILLLLAVTAAIGVYALADPHLSDAELPGVDGGGEETTIGAVDPVNETTVERLVAQEVNRFRSGQNRSMLTVDPELRAIAKYHSEDMAAENYTGHVAPDGETVADRFDRFGYACGSPSELVLFTEYGRQISVGDTTMRFESQELLARGIVDLWRRSPSHREALLATSWHRVGVGVVVTASNRVYVTLNAC